MKPHDGPGGMTFPFLPLDVARCKGKPAGPQGLHVQDECYWCLRRRTPAPAGMAVWMEAPDESPCPQRMEP